MTDALTPFGPITAVRTVEESDDFRMIEGRAIAYGGPFNGRDTYGTFFSARSDIALETPIKVWYNHGFDKDFKFSTIGHVTSVRTEDDGVWVQAQLDKRHRYYETRVKPLLEQNGLGFSPGSAEHSYREDPRTGELLDYPVHEISLTPTEANPWAMIAARSAEVVTILAARATDKSGKAIGPPEGGKDRADIPDEDYAGPDKSYPIVDQGSVDDAARLVGKADNPDAVKAKVIAIAKRKGLKIPDAWQADSARSAARSASMDAASASQIMTSLLYLRDCEMGEGDQVADLDAAIKSVQSFINKELAEPDELADAGDMGLSDAVPMAAMSAVRKGARNSQKDLTRINAIADHAAAIAGHVVALGGKANDAPRAVDGSAAQSPAAPDGDAASRSADPPTVVTITQRVDVAAIRAQMLEEAARVGQETAKALTG